MAFFKNFRKKINTDDIAPDEIFLDSTNLPEFDRNQFEGRLERPISHRTGIAIGTIFAIAALIFSFRLWNLQITQGNEFAERSKNNSLRHTLVFADRGVIFDRNNTLLAWNVENPEDEDFSFRQYSTTTGLSNLLGYVKYPSKDSSGFYYREDYLGIDGVEKVYHNILDGVNGLKITETNVRGKIESQSVMSLPVNGENLTLSIDSRIQSKLHDIIQGIALERGFTGGAGVIMDVKTGEILTHVTYPEYDSQVLTDGSDAEKISGYFSDKSNPLLDRVTSGLYTPGSIIKPFMALAALNEGVISPNKVIYTTGSISLKNPYNPDVTYVYRDWKNHGPVDMRKAIEQSSDVYFYEIGGGFEDQRGMGISNIDKYSKLFGFGSEINSEFFGKKTGTIPTPEWKKQVFNGEAWTVGNTYHAVIGQYGFQVTPIQVVRAIGAVANKGTLLTPTLVQNDRTNLKTSQQINLPEEHYQVVHDGMRQGAIRGTAAALNVPYVTFAAKTGTAELGVKKDFVNSWVTGFFPYENPRYSFVILMERGPRGNLVGASAVARQLFDWMNANTPEYFSSP